MVSKFPKFHQTCDRVALLGSAEYADDMLAMSQKYAWDLSHIDAGAFPQDIWYKLAHIEYLIGPITARGYANRVDFENLVRLQAALQESKIVKDQIQLGLAVEDRSAVQAGYVNANMDEVTKYKKISAVMDVRRKGGEHLMSGASDGQASLARSRAEFQAYGGKYHTILRTFDRLIASLKALLYESKNCQASTFF